MPDLRRKFSRPKEPKPLSAKKTDTFVSLFVPYKSEVLACVELNYNANATQARLLAGGQGWTWSLANILIVLLG
jgi:hypothetical protein